MRLLKSDKITRKMILGVGLFSIVFHVNAQSDQVDNLAQFLFPQFSIATVRMNVGKGLTLMMNYNIVTEKMVFLQKGQVFDMLNQQNVDTIIVNDSKFIPVSKAFHEVILEGPVNLYIQHRGIIQEPGKPAAYGGTSQVSSSTYLSRVSIGDGNNSIFNMKLPAELIVKPETVFWMTFNNNKYSFTNERQFLKIFPGKEIDIKKYIKQNRLKFENSEDVKKLAQYGYSLIK
jgi:hypothetical protein